MKEAIVKKKDNDHFTQKTNKRESKYDKGRHLYAGVASEASISKPTKHWIQEVSETLYTRHCKNCKPIGQQK